MEFKTKSSDQATLEELGKRLSRHRLNQNLSQEDLAKEAGTGVNTIYRIEQGHSTQMLNLIRVLRVLGLTDNLDLLAPELPPSPIEQLKLKKAQRLRASRRTTGGGANSSNTTTQAAGWSWRDES